MSKIKRIISFITMISIVGLSGCAISDKDPQDGTTNNASSSIDNGTVIESGCISDIFTDSNISSVGTDTSVLTDDSTTVVESVNEQVSEATIETEKSDGGFNVETTATTAETTTAPPETYVPETEASITKPTIQEVPIGAPIETTYAYNTLTDREKALYDSIKSAIINLESEVDIQTNGYTEDEWTKVFCDVYYQETGLFWVDPYLVPGEIYYKTTNIEEIKNMQTEIDNMVYKITDNAASYKTEIDRIKYIHDYLISINDFEKGGAASYSPTIYGGLVLGHPQCEGYAKTFAHICNKIGLETIVMTGNVSSGASHAWNKVKIGEKWYNIDLTNDDPILQTPNNKYVRYNYFLVPDAWIENITHFRPNLSQMYSAVELFKAPIADSSDYYYFNYYDTAYSDYSTAYNELLNRVINGINNRSADVQIRLTNYDTFITLKNNLIALKDDAKAATGGPWKRIAAASDDILYIITISVEY